MSSLARAAAFSCGRKSLRWRWLTNKMDSIVELIWVLVSLMQMKNRMFVRPLSKSIFCGIMKVTSALFVPTIPVYIPTIIV